MDHCLDTADGLSDAAIERHCMSRAKVHKPSPSLLGGKPYAFQDHVGKVSTSRCIALASE
jgi:hypothetical protein